MADNRRSLEPWRSVVRWPSAALGTRTLARRVPASNSLRALLLLDAAKRTGRVEAV